MCVNLGGRLGLYFIQYTDEDRHLIGLGIQIDWFRSELRMAMYKV